MAARIGIFDSGVGGLSILRDVRKIVPGADYLYLGDTANVPYGGRSVEDIERLSTAALDRLRSRGADLVIVACNTVTSVAIQKLRSLDANFPMIGVIPVLKTLAARTKTKKVAVLATEATLTSHSYTTLKQTYASDIEVLELALPEWVLFVESGLLDGQDVRRSIASVSAKVKSFGADIIALGCTHFTFLRQSIEAAIPGVEILDSGEAVARQVQRVLEQNAKLPGLDTPGSVTYLCTGDPDKFQKIAAELLGEDVRAEKV